ncbi:MAG: response regulator transcription factor [Bacteroidota bacterium]
MLNILIVDDHQVLVDGIKALLSSEPDLRLSHVALDARSALEVLKEEDDLQLILLDVNLPDIDGVALCKEICEKYPDIPIIALTMHHEPGIISNMIRAGAKGYLLKNTGKEELISAIRHVAMGNSYYSKDVTQQLLASMGPQSSKQSSSKDTPKITRREKEVLKLIIEEFTTEEIAEKLFISASTVISHRKSLLRKLQAKNSAGLVKAAYERGLVGG